MRRMFGSPAQDGKTGGRGRNGDADASKDRPRVRDSLFSPSASSSSSVEGEGERENVEEYDEDDRLTLAPAPKAPLFPSRAGSMLGANARSRSANTNSKKQFADVRRRTMVPASSSFTLGSTTASTGPAADARDNLSSSAMFPERRGLFEADDEAESLESFQERVKVRQSKKKSELDALRGQLEAAQQRVDQLEAQVVREAREKQEFEIRMKECQRIIEKRNKQLMKASERMARFTEQSEGQSAELQAKAAALTAENSQLRADMSVGIEQARAAAERRLEAQQAEFAAKMKQHERHWQGKLDRAVESTEQGAEAKEVENLALRGKIRELEAKLEATTALADKAKIEAEAANVAAATATSLSPSRIKQSEEYQLLLKQVENAEAVSRGLRFQLDKEREEKKYLKQQLSAVHSSGASVAGYFDVDAGASKLNASPTSSAASAADLAHFDYTAAPTGAAEDGSAPPSPANARQRSRSQSRSRSGSSGLFSSHPFGLGKHVEASEEARDVATAAQDIESKRKKRGSSTTSLQTPLESFPHDSTDEAASSPATVAQKSIASSVNFFEKFSIKFKRSSSPRNSATAGNAKAEDTDPPAPTVNTSVASPGVPSTSTATGSSVVSPLPRSAVSARRKVLNERPRMYVARSPSHHEEESSDSIFGSESDSFGSSDSDGETPPLPPPPPAQDEASPRPVTVHTVPVPIPPQLMQVDAGAEAGSSDSEESSRSNESSDEEPSRSAAASIPTPTFASCATGASTTPAREQPWPRIPHVATGVEPIPFESDEFSSSDSSNDSSSDEDEDDGVIGTSRSSGKPSPIATPAPPRHQERSIRSKSEQSSSSSSESSSSSSDDEAERLSSKQRSRGRVVGAAADSKPRRKREKRSLSLPRSPDGATAQSLHHDARHKAAAKSRMNEYMEARTKKRNDRLKKKEEKEHAEYKKKEEYEKEWEKMAQEERERKRKQQQARRTGRRRPASMKTVRVSQMRQQMTKQGLQKDVPTHSEQQQQQQRPRGDTMEEGRSRRHSQHKNESKESGSDADEDKDGKDDDSKPAASGVQSTEDSPPLPPEPTEADTELYIRQQARLRERHELEMRRKLDADEADQVRGQIHRKVEMWAFGKELLHMILTLDQISNSDALKTCQLMVVQSPDSDTVRKAYRSIIRVIHPDKLRNASVPEQLEAKELFTVLNQAFERFKAQAS